MFLYMYILYIHTIYIYFNTYIFTYCFFSTVYCSPFFRICSLIIWRLPGALAWFALGDGRHGRSEPPAAFGAGTTAGRGWLAGASGF